MIKKFWTRAVRIFTPATLNLRDYPKENYSAYFEFMYANNGVWLFRIYDYATSVLLEEVTRKAKTKEKAYLEVTRAIMFSMRKYKRSN